MARVSRLAVLIVLAHAIPAGAQDQWGLSVGVTPSWESGSPVSSLFAADQIQMQGSEVRLGVVRGELLEGDWGLSYVDKSIDENSIVEDDLTACSRGACGTFFRTLPQTRLTGVEFHQFQPFKTWKDRIQLGMVGAVGVGWLRGSVYKRTVSEGGDVESFDAAAGELFRPSASLVPLMKLEIAAAGIVMPGLKVRVGGGFSMPGYHTFGVTVFYLVPQR
jgi:hypothetical protein